MWVPLVENQELDGEGSDYFVKKNLNHLMAKDPRLDTVILGCTHYPLLIPTIRKFFPSTIRLISQGEIVAPSLVDYLARHPEIDQNCTQNGNIEYYTTETPSVFEKRASIFSGEAVEAQHIKIGY